MTPTRRNPISLVGADRPLVGDGRVDGEAVMSALLDEPAGERPHGVSPEAPAVHSRREEDVDVGVPVVGVRLLVRLNEPD